MKKLSILLMIATVVTAVIAPPCLAVDTVAVKDKYQAIQVDRFDIRSGVTFPVDYLLTLQEEILKQMQASNLFPEVLRPGESPAKAKAVLRLTGTVTRFKAGSRAKRYVVGFGAGSTEIFAHLVFLDAATGKPIITDDVRAVMAGGFVGGESLNVTRDFARRVVTSAKVVVAKRMTETVTAAAPAEPVPAVATPAPELTANTSSKVAETSVAVPATEPSMDAAKAKPLIAEPVAANMKGASPSTSGTSAGRHLVKFLSKDLEGTETALNAEGKAGYHLLDFALTGKDSAEITLEQSAPGAKYQYHVLHTRLAGTMAKEMNKAAEEGYRLCAQTVGQFGGVMTAILEKAPDAGTTRYTYRVHQTVRVASAQKDTEKDQAEGYVLAGATHQNNVHLVVLEKQVTSGEQAAK